MSKIPEPYRSACLGLLEQYAHYWAIASKLAEMDVNLPSAMEIDVLDFVADCAGIPPDNTVEHQDEICQCNGKWPEGVYCRDWITDTFQDIINEIPDEWDFNPEGFLSDLEAG